MSLLWNGLGGAAYLGVVHLFAVFMGIKVANIGDRHAANMREGARLALNCGFFALGSMIGFGLDLLAFVVVSTLFKAGWIWAHAFWSLSTWIFLCLINILWMGSRFAMGKPKTYRRVDFVLLATLCFLSIPLILFLPLVLSPSK